MKSKDIIQNIKNKINKQNIKDIIFFFIISIIFFGIFINIEYATDTYTVFSVGAKQDIIHFLGSGRFVTAFFTLIARILNLGETSIYVISFMMAIISLVLSLYEMNKIIKKDIKNKTISKITSILIVVNVFIIELFLFIEKGILVLSILFNIYAIKHLIKYFETKNKKELLKVLFFMLLANGSYQGTVGLFIALAMVYIIKYSKNIKEFIINNILTGICYVIPAVLDLIIAKIFAGSRVSGEVVIKEAINKLIIGSKDMIGTYSLIPKYIFSIFLMIIIGILIYKIIKCSKKKIIDIMSIIYIILGTYLVTMLPQLLQNTSSIWIVPRSTFTFASLIGILILYLFMNFYKVDLENNIKEEKKVKYFNCYNLIIVISVIYIFIEYVNFMKIGVDRYKLNQADKEITIQIAEKIKEYELNTGNKVNKIAIYQDENILYTYDGIKATKDLNVRAYSADWSTKSIIEYYGKRKLERVNQDSEIAEEFLKNDWNCFDSKQVVFKDDILHLCCY